MTNRPNPAIRRRCDLAPLVILCSSLFGGGVGPSAWAQSGEQATQGRCTPENGNLKLCLQSLRLTQAGLTARMTVLDSKGQIQSLSRVSLSLDGQPLSSASTAVRSGPQLIDGGTSLLVVMQSANRQRDRDALPQLRSGLMGLADALRRMPGTRISLFGYNVVRPDYQPEPQPSLPFGSPEQLRAFAQDLQLPTERMRSPTELYDALDEALSRIGREPAANQRMVLVFSDGTENSNSKKSSFRQLQRRANEAGVAFSFILLPYTNDAAEVPEYVRRLTEATGGSLRSPAPSDLRTAFAQFSDELERQTVATFQAPAVARPPGVSAHQVKLAALGLTLQSSIDIDWTPTAPRGEVIPPTTPKRPLVSAATGDSRDIWGLLGVGLLGFTAFAGIGLLVLRRNSSRWPRRSARPRPDAKTRPLGPPLRPTQRLLPSRSTPTADPTAARWLFDVTRQRSYVISRLPADIGNDLDCHVVLGKPGDAPIGARIERQGDRLALQPAAGTRLVHNQQEVRQSLILHDHTEFVLGDSYLVYFETPLAANR